MLAVIPYWFASDSHEEATELGRRGPSRSEIDPGAAEPALVVVAADYALAARVRDGDEVAFGEMYRAYYAALAEYAAGVIGEAASAHDVVQEVFLNIWRDRSEWHPGHIAAYVYRATRNRSLNYVGAQRRRVRLHTEHQRASVLDDQVPGSGEPPLAPDDALHLAHFRRALTQAIEALPVAGREVAILRWRHGRSLAEIAAVTGSSVKAVSMQLARTRVRLQTVVDAFLRNE